MELLDSDRLDSWREIAAYIKRDERTAMRWAKLYGMPVHHAPGGSHARVFAYRSEVTAWVRLQDRREKEAHSLPAASGEAGLPAHAVSLDMQARITIPPAVSASLGPRPGFFDYLGNRKWLLGLGLALLTTLLLVGKLFLLR